MTRPFSRPPVFADGPEKLEDYACRRALTLARLSAGQVCRKAGLDPARGRLTFDTIGRFADFPARPAVGSGEPQVDLPTVLLAPARFRKSALWAAWVGACDAAGKPVTTASLDLVLKAGGSYPTAVVVSPAAYRYGVPTAPFLAVGSEATAQLWVVAFDEWVRALDWAAAPDQTDDESTYDAGADY